MSDTDYHKQHSREEHFYSSSQLKTMLESPKKFHQHYILGKKPGTPSALQDAFDVGTVVHTAILEPENLKGSYVLWKTGNRTGEKWAEFKAANEGKLILTANMKKQAQNAIKAVKASKFHKEIYSEGESEISFFSTTFHGIRIKVRTDWLNQIVIDDLKTTTGDVTDVLKIKNKIKSLNYDLSAALYVDVVNHCIDEFSLDMEYVETFRWNFASKDDTPSFQVYDALPYLPMGRAKYMEAIRLIKFHEANNWSFPEEIIMLEPFSYEVSDWIKPETTILSPTESEESDEDLL